MVSNGFLSRVAGNKRGNSPEMIRARMKKWLHFLREKVFFPRAVDHEAAEESGKPDTPYVFILFLVGEMSIRGGVGYRGDGGAYGGIYTHGFKKFRHWEPLSFLMVMCLFLRISWGWV